MPNTKSDDEDDFENDDYKTKLYQKLESHANSKDDNGMDRIEKLCKRIPEATKDCSNKFDKSYSNFMKAMDGGFEVPENKN